MLYRMTSCLALALTLAAFVGVSATAQDKDSPDNKFLIAAAQAQHAIVRMTELVETRSDNAKVEEFARMVLAEHKKVGERIGELAKDRKVGVAAGLEKETRDVIDDLSKRKAADFDRAYLDAFIRLHEKCVTMCKEHAADDKNTLSAFAKECMPMLEKHLKQARELRQAVGN